MVAREDSFLGVTEANDLLPEGPAESSAWTPNPQSLPLGIIAWSLPLDFSDRAGRSRITRAVDHSAAWSFPVVLASES
jgi:hypothetical protein